MTVGVAVGTGVDVVVGAGVDVVVGVNVAVGVEEGKVSWRPPVTAKVGVAVGVGIGVGVGVGVDRVTAPMERVVALWFGDSSPRIYTEAMMKHTPRNAIQKFKPLWPSHIFGLGLKMATPGTTR